MFTTTLEQIAYDCLLKHYILPSCQQTFGYNYKIIQDNDSKHTSFLCRETIRNHNIEWVIIMINF